MLPAPDVQSTSLPPSPLNVYANTMSGVVPCPLCNLPPRVYVPNSTAGTVDVIDPLTMKVIDRYRVGSIPHHITPSWDLSELYVDNGGFKQPDRDRHPHRQAGADDLGPFPL